MKLPFVDDQVTALFGGKVTKFAFKRSLIRVDPLVDFECPLAGAGVSALGTLNGLSGLVFPGVLPQSRFIGALKITLHAVKRVLCAMFNLNVRF